MRPAVILAAALLALGYNAMRREQAQLDLARTAYGEARGEGVRGMQGVINVVMNRAALGGWWGDGVLAVVHKPWQFSVWNEGDPNREKIARMEPGQGDPVFDTAYELAGRALDGELPDVTGGATHYYNPAVVDRPSWNWGELALTAIIGNHEFYRSFA